MRIADTQLALALSELMGDKAFPVERFGQVLRQFLVRKRLTKRTGKILRALETETDKRAGIVLVQATLTHPPTDSVKEMIQRKATELFGDNHTQTQVSFREDPSLLGGVRLETGSVRYDFSLHRSLTELRKSLSH